MAGESLLTLIISPIFKLLNFVSSCRTVSQNHNYAVDPMSVDATGLKVTHLDIMDDVIEGLCCEADRVFTIQYHPDTMSGPSGSTSFYKEFIGLMKEGK